jgi:hypothetical protein
MQCSCHAPWLYRTSTSYEVPYYANFSNISYFILFGCQVFSWTRRFQALNTCSSINMRDRVLHSHKITGNMRVLGILTFTFLYRRLELNANNSSTNSNCLNLTVNQITIATLFPKYLKLFAFCNTPSLKSEGRKVMPFWQPTCTAALDGDGAQKVCDREHCGGRSACVMVAESISWQTFEKQFPLYETLKAYRWMYQPTDHLCVCVCVFPL